MTKHDWDLNYTASYLDNYGTRIDFNPLHSNNVGSMVTTRTNGFQIGGEYTLKEELGDLYLGWGDLEFLVRPTEKGFDLISGESVEYSYARIE